MRAVCAREKAGRRKWHIERATEWPMWSRPGAGEKRKGRMGGAAGLSMGGGGAVQMGKTWAFRPK